MDLIYNRKVFKQFRDSIYYVSKDGEVYSTYKKGIMKGLVRFTRGKRYRYIDVWNRELNRRQHVNIHKMVYIAWVRELEDVEQVNHKNDDSLDNRLSNLYVGNQQENVNDCVTNGHRVGRIFYLTVFDKKESCVLTFCPSQDFIAYCGHSNKSGSVKKFFNKRWFKNRYDILDFKSIKSLTELNSFKSVTTMRDECNAVG